MSRRALTFGMLLLILGALVLAERARDGEPDWRPSYEHDVSEPRGGRALYTLLPELLGGAPVERLGRAPYRYLREAGRTGETYVVVTTQFAPDSVLAETFVRYAERGNTVFVAAEEVEGTLAQRLRLRTERPRGLGRATEADSVLHLANPRLARPGGYRFDEPLAGPYVIPLESARVTVLGFDEARNPTYVRVPMGEGAFYVLTAPRALSNVALLSADGAAFAAAALSYLPTQPAVWDTHFKPLRTREGTVLRYVQEDPALGWAYFLLLGGVVLFLLFRGRRWQRPIPVVDPPPNHALAFAQTMGRLYHQHGDDRLLVERKAQRLLDRLRLQLHDPDLSFAPEHRDRIAHRLDLPRDEVDALFDLILRLRAARTIRDADLLELDRRAHALTLRL